MPAFIACNEEKAASTKNNTGCGILGGCLRCCGFHLLHAEAGQLGAGGGNKIDSGALYRYADGGPEAAGISCAYL